MVRKAKRRQERDLANDHDKNGKKFTKYIKSKSNCRSTIRPLKDINGQLVTEHNDMANMLNRFFTSVFTHEDTINIPAIEKQCNRPMEEVTITKEKIRKKTAELRQDSAPGPDGITPKLLKNLGDSILGPLEMIYKKSLKKRVPGITNKFPLQASHVKFSNH
jgi:hypothetical protein